MIISISIPDEAVDLVAGNFQGGGRFPLGVIVQLGVAPQYKNAQEIITAGIQAILQQPIDAQARAQAEQAIRATADAQIKAIVLDTPKVAVSITAEKVG